MLAESLDDDEVVVAVVVDENDRRNADARQLVERCLEAVRLEAVRFQIALHVEQREALFLDLFLFAVREHLFEHGLFVDRETVVVGEQRRQRRGSAAEVVLLAHHGAKARFLDAGRGHRIGTADLHGKVDGTGLCGANAEAAKCDGKRRPCLLHDAHLT